MMLAFHTERHGWLPFDPMVRRFGHLEDKPCQRSKVSSTR